MSTSTLPPEELSLAALSPEEQRALLAQLLAEEAAAPTYPLSFNQQRLWVLDQLGAGAAYHIPLALQLEGALDLISLTDALNTIVQRHAILRTTYQTIDSQPQQVISENVTLACPLLDLQHLPPAEQTVQVEQLRRAETLHPFDLTCDLMVRAQVVRLAPELHLLMVTINHIAADGWSVGIFIREVAAFYTAFVNRHPAPVAELPIHYVDFAHWQRQQLQGERLDQLLTYWKTQLAGAPRLLELPTDRPRPTVQTYNGGQVTITLSPVLTQQVRQIGQRTGATLYTVLLTAFQILLARYTGQTDIVVGTPFANRTRQEVEPLIGFFVNTLALRTQLDGNPTFQEALARVQAVVQAAYIHQEAPFERLVNELADERSLRYSPLVQILFALQSAPLPLVETPGLRIRRLPVTAVSAQMDVEMLLWEINGGIQGGCVYNSDLFDEATIVRLVGHFETLLQSIVARPAQPIMALPLLAAAEYTQIVQQWNATTVDFGQPQTLHTLFEQQAARTPAAIAVISPKSKVQSQFARAQTQDAENDLTYAELNARANQLAHYLLTLGVHPNAVVGIAIERSIEMIVAILAVLKAGATYLPLDPAHPAERLAYLLQDSQTTVLLTTAALAHNRSGAAVTQVLLDTLDLAAYAVTNPITMVQPDSAAYLIYTSGSTGQPKGVLMPHCAIWNLCQWQRQILPEPARTLQQSAITFDVACQELFTCWHTGGALLLIQEELRRDLPALLDFLAAADVERIFLPYVLLNALAEQATTQHCYPASLRAIITAGEQLIITPAIARWLEGLPAATLHNHYGPTETHVATAYALANSPAQWPVWVPIGRPIANVTTYLLDEGQTPVPVGVPGELYIGGAGLACGYHNRPALTAERFIHHPAFGRLYKTGDLCRWLPDGALEYIGRTDFQVKIRGFRIELGEIESALLAQPGVQEAVVAVYEASKAAGASDKRLVAYLLGAIDVDTLRRQLGQRLPEYMIPAAFVLLDAMPLTPNGKIDRKALPAPDWATTAHTAAFVPPSTPTEEVISQIWGEVLGLPQISIHDNFFQIGGHSLLATQVIARVHQRFPVDLPLRSLFEQPTVAGLAGQIDERLYAKLAELSEEEALDLVAQMNTVYA